MVRLASLDELAETMTDEAPCADETPRYPDEERRAVGILAAAARLYRAGNETAALETLLRTCESLSVMPTAILAKIIELSQRLNQEQRAAHECAAFARDAATLGYDDLALEAASAAMILDAMGQFEITRSPTACAGIAALYEQIARRLPVIRRPPHDETPHPTLRIAMIVPNLIDYVVAYTERILHFARHLDPERYRLAVYVSENLASREAPVFPFGCQNGSSQDTGAQTLAELQRLGVPLFICSNATGFAAAAGALASKLVGDRTDVAVFQSGLACPIDWLAARLSDIPVKLCIHTGCTTFIPGMDATFFDNPANLERETGAWEAIHGDRVLMHKGTDLAELRGYTAYQRSRFGIPENAVVIGAMSNHLDERLSAPYMTVLAELLHAHPDAWLLFFGTNELPDKMAFFHAKGVDNRVRFGGKQSRSAPALKVLDIYANEFPVGGSQSVIEAIACGLPVAAMKWSDAHAESVGAEIAGPDHGIASRDPAAYAGLLHNWIRDPQQRRLAGQSMLARAEQLFSVDRYVQKVMQYAEDTFRRKTNDFFSR